MIILALETSTKVCSAAIFHERQLAAECCSNLKNVHAALLFQQIEHVLHAAAVTPEELSAVAVSIGPGSFTGLRIGLAAAKGIAFASELPLIGVPSFEAAVLAAPVSEGTVAVVRRARKNEAFFAVYGRANETVEPLTEIRVVSLDALSRMLPTPGFVIGDTEGIETVDGCVVLPESLVLPSARYTGLSAVRKFEHGEFMDMDNSEPFYIQEFAATLPRAL